MNELFAMLVVQLISTQRGCIRDIYTSAYRIVVPSRTLAQWRQHLLQKVATKTLLNTTRRDKVL
jgi:hypothetical protein